jgi:hypothetical protein
LTQHGLLYNVSGNQAVELRLRRKKKFRLGTDEPERLQQVLESEKKNISHR